MVRLFVVLMALALLAANAFAAPVALDEYAQSRLDEGQRARVIVWLPAPSAELAADEGRSFADEVRQTTDDVTMRVFGLPAARMAEAAPGDTIPRIVRQYRYTPVVAMELSADEIARLAQDPEVRRIEADGLDRPALNDSVPLIGAAALHNGGNTGAGVAIAILDTGVDHEHPMFNGRIIGSACFSTTSGNSTSLCPGGANSDTSTPGAGDNCEEDEDDETNGTDGCFHGTHVAGIAAGGSFNDPSDGSRTLIGVAPGANIIAVQVFARFVDNDACGGSDPCVLSYTSDQLAALEWLYENRATSGLAAINMSLGGGRETEACPANGRASIIGQLRAAGIATVIASGNNGYSDSVNTPGCIPDAITVGSTTKADGLSGFSNSNDLVDVLAPGSSIRSAFPSANDSGNGRASSASGTSMATPHVAGAVALLRAQYPNMSVTAIENALEATGIPVTNASNNVTTPRIRVDLASAQLGVGGNGTIGGVMTIDPLEPFSSSGNGSDPSDYATRNYTLTNTSGAAITWQATGSADWLSLNTVANDAPAPRFDAPADTESGSLNAGASVVVRVGVNPDGLAPGTHVGTITFSANGQSPGLQIAASVSVGATPPVNDDFANALVLTQPSQIVSFNSVGASKETDEPDHTSSGGSSLWWLWTAPASGQVRMETQSATFDTMMAVYTGNAVNSLTEVASNDDINYEGGNTQSRVEFDATAGTTYAIAVDGFSGASGNAELSVAFTGAPANDNLASPMMLSGANGSQSVSNFNATREIGEILHGGVTGGASVWFSWQAPASGPVSFTATGGSAALLAAYDQNTHGGQALSQSASGSIDFTAASGTTYYIALDGTSGAQGLFTLTWLQGADPAHRLRAAMLPNARSVQVGSAATAFATVINPASFGATGANCRIEPPADFNGAFSFRRTNPSTNEPVGNEGDEISLPAGGSQTYVLSMTPGAEMNGVVMAPVFRCANIRPTDPIPGVTTMTLTAAASAGADIISIAATPTANGILAVPEGSAAAFSVAAVNIGATQSVTITPGTGDQTLPLTIDVCETNPGTGSCITSRQASVTVAFAANETRTFTIFVRSTGAVPFQPSTNRVFATFTNGSSVIVGATSVAVRSP